MYSRNTVYEVGIHAVTGHQSSMVHCAFLLNVQRNPHGHGKSRSNSTPPVNCDQDQTIDLEACPSPHVEPELLQCCNIGINNNLSGFGTFTSKTPWSYFYYGCIQSTCTRRATSLDLLPPKLQ